MPSAMAGRLWMKVATGGTGPCGRKTARASATGTASAEEAKVFSKPPIWGKRRGPTGDDGEADAREQRQPVGAHQWARQPLFETHHRRGAGQPEQDGKAAQG